jgi:diguanylate cyclase (GGDEF)-like protein
MDRPPTEPTNFEEASRGLREYIDRRLGEIERRDGFFGRVSFWSEMVRRLDASAVAALIALKELNEERDPLTGVLNRRGLERALADALEWETREGQPVTVVFIDLDRFKLFNDTYGHLAGDAVLQAWIGFLKDSIRRADSIGRYGGEEVVVVLRRATEEQGVRMFERLRKRMSDALERCLQDLGVHDRVTMSVGVAQHDGSESAQDLLKRADERMYEGKLAGRNIVIGGHPPARA